MSTDTDHVTLSMQQQAALDMLTRFATRKLGKSVAVLEGYAGTGKTTLVAELIDAVYKTLGASAIAVAAPTHKAAKVLKTRLRKNRWSASIALKTLHAFLGLRLNELADGTQTCSSVGAPCLDRYSLLIVDECSMIDDDLFAKLMAVKRDMLVLFVGDRAQLPPVSQSGSKASPVFDLVQLKFCLSEVMRQAAQHPSIAMSMVIRDSIESGTRVTAPALAAMLTSGDTRAGVVTGTPETVVNYALYELDSGRDDVRVIAYTNAAVERYNMSIHCALHGVDAPLYVDGERVIVHASTTAEVAGRANTDGARELVAPGATRSVQLWTNEELIFVRDYEDRHPVYGDIKSRRCLFRRESGDLVVAHIPQDQSDVDQRVAVLFGEWRRLKDEAAIMKRSGQRRAATEMREQAAKHSKKAWELKKAFAPIRHAYALTAHKSQGSTFTSAIVDFADLTRMRSAFEFNRALYVAVTRASNYLAVVV